MAARVLITGSRTWVNAAIIRDALLSVWGDGDVVLVSGTCPRGADRIAEMFWTRWGGQVRAAGFVETLTWSAGVQMSA